VRIHVVRFPILDSAIAAVLPMANTNIGGILSLTFKKAARKNSKLRLGMSAPSGGGKTFTALMIAKLLGCLKIALMDSERSSAEKYARKPNTPEGPGNWDFDHANLDEKHPQEYIDGLQSAARAGYDCIIIDSFTHAWLAVLEMVDRAGGKPGAWKVASPQYAKLIDSLMNYPGHVIATIRSKQAHDFEKDDKGKLQVKKLGLAPVAREGTEYEFDLMFDFTMEGTFTVSKSRCPTIPPGTVYDRGDIEKVVGRIKSWLDEGAPLSLVEEFQRRINFAQNQSDLDVVVADLVKAKDGGQLTEEDRKTLMPAFRTKKAQFQEAG
jgi:hypothetical protein